MDEHKDYTGEQNTLAGMWAILMTFGVCVLLGMCSR